MRSVSAIAWTLLIALAPGSFAVAGDEALPGASAGVRPTLEEIFRPPRLLGQRPRDAAVSADGSRAIFHLSDTDAIEPALDLRIVALDEAAAGVPAPRVLFPAADKARAWWTRRGAVLLVHRQGWLEIIDCAGGVGDASDGGDGAIDVESLRRAARPILRIGDEGSVAPRFLDDGRRVLVTIDGAGGARQIWLVDLESGARFRVGEGLVDPSAPFAVTADGAAAALFARPADADADAAGEDASKRSTRGVPAAEGGSSGEDGEGDKPPRRLHIVPLSPDGAARAFAIEDGARVELSGDARRAARIAEERPARRRLVVPDYLTATVTTRPTRGSLAGDPPAIVAVEVHDLETGASFAPALDASPRWHLRGAAWSPDGERLLVDRVSEDHRVRELAVVEAAARVVRVLVTDRDAGWIGGPLVVSSWLDSGALLFTSERSGYNHVYRLDVLDGAGAPRALTAGGFEVQSIERLDGDRHALLVTNEIDPTIKTLCRIDLETGEREVLSATDGCASRVAASADGRVAIYVQERLGVPGDLHAVAIDGSSAPARLTATAPAALADLALPPPEIVEFRNPDDGARVRALLYPPQPREPGRRYPAVVFIHGAGYLQNVTRSMTAYDVNMLFHHRLARRGYAVLDVDYRHSAGYGRDFRAAVRGWMGGKDLDDVAAGVAYLESLSWVDVDRAGVYGGSYGGFLTLMALFTKPDLFACGAALRSVTDWRSYHAPYTNPRLGSPEKEPESYRRSSPIDHAEGLRRPLLLLHGLVDGNVFAQDTIRLVEKLIGLGKDFELMLYPSQDHAFTDPASWIDEYRRIETFFDRHLRPGAAAAAPAAAARRERGF